MHNACSANFDKNCILPVESLPACFKMRRRISIRGCVRLSVCPSVRPVLFSKVKSTNTRRILCRVSGLVFFCVCMCGEGGGLVYFISFRSFFSQNKPDKSGTSPFHLGIGNHLFSDKISIFPYFLPFHYGRKQKKNRDKIAIQ